MKFIKLTASFFAAILFLTACTQQPNDTVYQQQQYPNDVPQREIIPADADYWARDNLDLRAVGALLEKADDAEEFEYLLNSENGVNNLDLNGDGYVDYIGVREFDDRDDNERGFSLFSMFGPDLIQEIATIIFNRDGLDNRGARILLTGNEQIYGDNYYYETNWLDRTLPIVNQLFSDRGDQVYQSPYYYENYPDYYDIYETVETPVYRTRVEQYYVTNAPVFIQTAQPTVINKIKIKSPYKGKSIDKIYSKLAKPTNEQIEFKKNNPNKPEFVKVKKDKKEDFSVKADKQPKGNPNKFDDRPKDNPKFDKPGKPVMINEKPNKVEKVKINQPNPVKAEKPQKQQGNPNKENKSGKGNGGGNKGGGKGGGKKG